VSVAVDCVCTVCITKQLLLAVGYSFVLKNLYVGFNSAAIQSFHPMEHLAFLAFRTFSLYLLYESSLNCKH